MAFFWFWCSVVAGLYVAFLKRKVRRLQDIEHQVKQSVEALAEAKTKHDDAQAIVAKAERLSRESARHSESVAAQNKVLNSAIEEVVNLWVNDSWKSISDKLTASNFATQKSRMEKVFDTCRKHGIDFDGRQERAFYVRLETEWKREVEAEKARAEQARIKELMREEQQAEKMRASELKKIEEERRELEKKHQEHLERIRLLQEMESLKKLSEEQSRELAKALAENSDLEKEIAERERRKSMAEMTRAGNVYVISNIGSFGEKVFKVGMTRRLIPEDRIKELGDASVPFPFDVHMMIPAQDAPALECKLHDALWEYRLNLVNDGKEFFRIDLQTIKSLVDKHSSEAVYEFIPVSQAAQWRESELLRKQNQVGKYRKESETPDEDSEAA